MHESRQVNRLAVVDLSRPRSNVLMYFGTGGIGKTTLSRQLQHLVETQTDTPLVGAHAAARIDFDNGTPFELEGLVLAMRASVWQLKKRWDAFDIVFRLYWARAHPGEPLREFVRHHSALQKIGGHFSVGDQVVDASEATILALTEVSSVATTARRLAETIYTAARTSKATRHLRRSCPYFEPLLESIGSEESLSYLPSLLAWELARYQRDHDDTPVMFIDTCEALAQHPTRETERLLQRVIYLTPNALFVLTGRDRLDWGDTETQGELDYVGPDRWPNLPRDNQDAEPRQHRVGYLSLADCESFLCSVINAEGEPAIARPIRDCISVASEGLPLYLDLAVGYFLDLVGRGKTPGVDDFGGPLPAVVARTMRDLPPAERALMRAVSLVDAFDEDLARAGAGEPEDSALVRFVNRGFIESAPAGLLPFALHRSLREAVRDADRTILRDGWSPREWTLAGERLLQDLGRRYEATMRPYDRELLGFVTHQGLQLAAEVDSLPPWLIEAAKDAAEVGLWQALMTTDAEPIASADAFCYGIAGLALRRYDLDQAIMRFQRALASDVADHPREFLQMHFSHALRNRGRYDEAEAQYAGVIRAKGRYRDSASYQLADIAYLRGRFPEALESTTHPYESTYLRGEQLRLIGHIRRAHADFDAAESAYREALDVAHQMESLALEAKALTNLVETNCWLRPTRSEHMVDRAWQANETLGNRLELLKLHVAMAVSRCKPGNSEEVDRSVNEAMALVEATHYEAAGIFALIPRAFQFALDEDCSALEATVSEVGSISDRLDGVYAWWAEIPAWWIAALGGPRRRVSRSRKCAWLGGATAVRPRWTNVLEARR